MSMSVSTLPWRARRSGPFRPRSSAECKTLRFVRSRTGIIVVVCTHLLWLTPVASRPCSKCMLWIEASTMPATTACMINFLGIGVQNTQPNNPALHVCGSGGLRNMPGIPFPFTMYASLFSKTTLLPFTAFISSVAAYPLFTGIPRSSSPTARARLDNEAHFGHPLAGAFQGDIFR